MSDRLVAKLDHRLDEVLDYDFVLGIAGGAGALWVAIESPKSLATAVPVAIGVVGVVIGAVIAGMAVIAAFMDTLFLRRIHAIGKRAGRYVTPFAFTAALGVIAALLLVVFSALPQHPPAWLRDSLACFAGLFTVWTVASVLPLLSMTLDFVDLKSEAADVSDDVLDNQEDGNVHPINPRSTGS